MQITTKNFYLIPLNENKIPKNVYPNELSPEDINQLGKPKIKRDSEGKILYSYYSWTMYYKYFQESGLIDKWLSKCSDWGIVTGEQPNGKTLLIVDQDSHGKALSNAIEYYLGKTYSRSTPSNKRHFYYYVDVPTGKEKIEGYTLEDEELKIEFLCSSETSRFQAGFKGSGREVVSDMSIRYIGSMDKDYLFECLNDNHILKPLPRKIVDYSNYKPLNITATTDLPKDIIHNACKSLIYPIWISKSLNKERDNAVKAINGYMLRLGYKKSNIKTIIEWINTNAEPNNPRGESPRNTEIAGKTWKRMMGKPKLLELGFNEFVNFLEANSISYTKKLFKNYKLKLDNGIEIFKLPDGMIKVVDGGKAFDILLEEDSLKELVSKGYVKNFDIPLEDIIKYFKWIPI